ncbi:hypothetical protein PRZ48_009319 [Zasmidium cellare]|uniref:Uncharacterized protein n=1 Tax=Zasmidium cellare TaxID=395010 RepID=A0ABR0EBS0_ZASCE|nr:hypothetical protein PRZ48_009319 [Zasmidium cellare]
MAETLIMSDEQWDFWRKELEKKDRADKSLKDNQPVVEILLNWFIQVTGLTAAIVFGVFSILSWTDSRSAKKQADTANLLAFVSICTQGNDNYLASSLPLHTSPANPEDSGTTSLSTGTIVGIVVSLSLLLVVVPVTFAAYRFYNSLEGLRWCNRILFKLCHLLEKIESPKSQQ